jgi:hypothetical protein
MRLDSGGQHLLEEKMTRSCLVFARPGPVVTHEGHPSCSLPDQAQMGLTARHRERSMADARYGHCTFFNVPLRHMNAPPRSVMLV